MGFIRDTCSFFRSIYEGSKRLKPAERLEIYETIFDYMFYDKEADSEQVKPSTYLAFMSNRLAFDNAKARYDKQKECGEYGKMGAEYGKLGGRGKKKTPINPQGGFAETPENPQEVEIDIEVEDKVSKKESNEKEINSLTPARAYARESYDEILSRLGFSDDLKPQVFKFIAFQQANGKKVTNAMLERTIAGIKGAAENRVRDSLSGDFMEKLKADLTPYREDVEQYIHASIQQALDGGWFELKEPKDFRTAAEWEREAMQDMGVVGNENS